MKILVVDIETTGFYPSDAIVEIGISLVDTVTRKVILVFDEVIKEKKFTKWKHKNAWIFQNTTLTVEDVMKANSLEYHKPEIQALFDKYKMTAYNKSFDLRFLRKAGFVIDDIKCLMKSATEYSKLKDKNIGILITDHNVHETLKITDRAYLLFEGSVLKTGTAEELASDPHLRKVYLGENFELRK